MDNFFLFFGGVLGPFDFGPLSIFEDSGDFLVIFLEGKLGLRALGDRGLVRIDGREVEDVLDVGKIG